MMNTTLIIYALNAESELKNNLRGYISNFFSIIIVDDGSVDETALYIDTHFKGIKLIRHQAHIGYSASINHVMTLVETSFAVICVPEIRFISLPHVGDKCAFDESPGIILPAHFDFVLTTTRSRICCDTDSVFKQAICVNREQFIHLGGLDELCFSFGYEWVDFLYRFEKRGWHIKRDTLWKIECQFQFQILKNNIRPDTQRARNEMVFNWKNRDGLSFWFFHGLDIVVSMVTFQLRTIRGVFLGIFSLFKVRESRLSRLPTFVSDSQLVLKFKKGIDFK
jgi:glycosyltransferase involved in cell wall biosynthesis